MVPYKCLQISFFSPKDTNHTMVISELMQELAGKSLKLRSPSPVLKLYTCNSWTHLHKSRFNTKNGRSMNFCRSEFLVIVPFCLLITAIVYQVIIIHSRKFQSMTTANAYVIVAGEIAESGKIPLPKGSSQIMFEVGTD